MKFHFGEKFNLDCYKKPIRSIGKITFSIVNNKISPNVDIHFVDGEKKTFQFEMLPLQILVSNENKEFLERNQTLLKQVVITKQPLLIKCNKEYFFRIESDNDTYIVPCIEFARALFLYDNFFAKIIFDPNPLQIIASVRLLKNEVIINLNRFYQLPRQILQTQFNLRRFIWLLTNEDARTSFLNIGHCIKMFNIDKWSFYFNLPNLINVRLIAEGAYDKKGKNTFYIKHISVIDFSKLITNKTVIIEHPKLNRIVFNNSLGDKADKTQYIFTSKNYTIKKFSVYIKGNDFPYKFIVFSEAITYLRMFCGYSDIQTSCACLSKKNNRRRKPSEFIHLAKVQYKNHQIYVVNISVCTYLSDYNTIIFYFKKTTNNQLIEIIDKYLTTSFIWNLKQLRMDGIMFQKIRYKMMYFRGNFRRGVYPLSDEDFIARWATILDKNIKKLLVAKV